jgi:hypothetical protein
MNESSVPLLCAPLDLALRLRVPELDLPDGTTWLALE